MHPIEEGETTWNRDPDGYETSQWYGGQGIERISGR